MFHLYGFFIGLAIVVGYSLAEKLEPRVSKVAPWVIGLGLFGARVYHVIDLWSYYSQNLWQIPMMWMGGLSIWGALIAASLVMLIYFKGETLKVMGSVVTVLPLSQAIGRIGNGVNGEFINKVWFLPWWSTELVLALILFGILWGMHLRGVSSKVKVATYLIGYGLIRYFLQPYR